MESAFKIWKTNRSSYLKFFNDYTLEQLNKTPKGFSNNLIWNIGHIVVTQQALLYKLSGLPGYISDEIFNQYKIGSKPTGTTTQQEADELKELLISLIEKTETDFNSGKFTSFTERTLGTELHLASIADAIEFNNYHEGIHLGLMMNIRKFV